MTLAPVSAAVPPGQHARAAAAGGGPGETAPAGDTAPVATMEQTGRGAPRRRLFIPPFDALADPRVLARLAASAEGAGWDGVFLWDHLVYAEPAQALLDPWIALAAIATTTERMTLGVMVTPLTRRRPAVVARQAVALDLLSQGRLVLGFGLGDDGSARELSRLGEETDPRTRAARLDEGLDLLLALLSGETVHHRGEHFVADGVRFLPRPHGDRRIPVWIAGRWPNQAPLRRAARHDGAFVISLTGPAQVAELREALAGHGAPEGFEVVELPPDGNPGAWERSGATWLLTRVTPYRADLAAVEALVAAGPRR